MKTGSIATLSRPEGSGTAVLFGSPEGGSRISFATQFSSRSLGEFSPSRASLNKPAIGLEKATSRSLGVPARRGLGVAEQSGVSFSKNILSESMPLKPLSSEGKQPEIAKSPSVLTAEKIKSMPAFELPKQQEATETSVTEVVPKVERAAIVAEMKQQIVDAYESHPVSQRSESTITKTLEPYIQARAKKLPIVQVEPIKGFDVLAKPPAPVEQQPTAAVTWLRKLQEKEVSKVKDEEDEKTAIEEKEETPQLSQLQMRVATQVQELQRGTPVKKVQLGLELVKKQLINVKADLARHVVSHTTAVPLRNVVSTELTNAENVIKTKRMGTVDPLVEEKNHKITDKDTQASSPFPAGILGVDEVAVAIRVEEAMQGVQAVSKTDDSMQSIDGAAVAVHTNFTANADSEIIKEMREKRPDFSLWHTRKNLSSVLIPKVGARARLRQIIEFTPPVARDVNRPVTVYDVRRVLFG